MARRPVLEFWYEFASTYSYLAASRIEPLAEAAGVRSALAPVPPRPDLRDAGLTSSPFNLYPAKGRHMWRDLEREAAPSACPSGGRTPSRSNSLVAARVDDGRRSPLGADLRQGGVPGRVRRGALDRRAGGDRRHPPNASGSTPTACCARRKRSRIRRGARPTRRRPVRAARSGADLLFRGAPARCSGATTVWSRRSPGRQGSGLKKLTSCAAEPRERVGLRRASRCPGLPLNPTPSGCRGVGLRPARSPPLAGRGRGWGSQGMM